MTCCRYVELNPVRARMVTVAEDYRWSSYRAKVGLTDYRKVDIDDCYHGLGETEITRQSAYRHFVESGICSDEIRAIREAVQYGYPFGGQRFKREIEHKLGMRLTLQKRGRPRKTDAMEVLL